MADAPQAGDQFEGADPGMAAERTDLAWSRSGLSMGACGVVVLKGLPSVTGNPSHPGTGAVVLGLGLLTWMLGYVSSRRRRGAPGQVRPVATWRDLAPVAYGSAAIALAGLALVLLAPA